MSNLIILLVTLSLISIGQAHISFLLENLKLNYTSSLHTALEDERVVSWSFGNIFFPANKSVQFDLKFFAPTAPGNYQVIVFLTGLDGLAPAFLYTDFCSKLSVDTNSIIVAFDHISLPKLPDKEEKIFEKTLNWTLQSINQLFNSKNTPAIIKGKVFPDLKTNGVSLMSHSASGHTTVSYLASNCGLIKSLILLDPVDGYDPFGFIKIFITNPPNQLPFAIPTLVVSTGLDNVSNSPRFPACAPANLSNTRFYDALPGPTWYLNFTGYGHADVLDNWGRKYFADLICYPCKIDCDFDLYRTNLARAVGYFLMGVNLKDVNYLKALENPAESGLFDKAIEVDSIFKYNGYDVVETGPFCHHDNKDFFRKLVINIFKNKQK